MEKKKQEIMTKIIKICFLFFVSWGTLINLRYLIKIPKNHAINFYPVSTFYITLLNIFILILLAVLFILYHRVLERKKGINHVKWKQEQVYLRFFELFSEPAFFFMDNDLVYLNKKSRNLFGLSKGRPRDVWKKWTPNEDLHRIVNELKEMKETFITKESIIRIEEKEFCFIIDAVNDNIDGHDVLFFVMKDKVEERFFDSIMDEYNSPIYSMDKNLYCKGKKAELLSRVNHEFRTPINIIQGIIAYKKKLVNGIENEEIKRIISRDIGILERNIRRISKISNKFIDVLEINNKHVQINNYDIIISVAAITDTARQYAAPKGMTINLSSNTESCICAVDVDKFEKIILNLLSNAVKFGKKGDTIEVKVKVSCKDVSVVISGRSQKIKSSKIDLFKIFTQGEKLLTRSSEGLGAGLYLVKNYTKLHNGKVEFHSDNDVNTFKIVLPLRTLAREKVNDYIFEEELCRDKTHVEFSDVMN